MSNYSQTIDEYKQELINEGIKEPALTEAINEYREGFLAEQEANREREENLNKEVKLSFSFLGDNEILGYDKTNEAVGVKSFTKRELFEDPNFQKLARNIQNEIKSDEFKTFDQNDIYDIGIKNYFDLDNIKKYDARAGEDINYRDKKAYSGALGPEVEKQYRDLETARRIFQNVGGADGPDKVVSINALTPEVREKFYPGVENKNVKVTPELYDYLKKNFESKKRAYQNEFQSEEEYEAYLKDTLGDKYEAYKQYQKDPNSVKLPQKFVDGAKKQLYREKLNRYFRSNVAKGIDDTLVQEAIKYLNFSDVSETKKTFESTRSAIEEEDEEIRKDLNKLDNQVAEYTENINGLMEELNELSGFATVDGEKVSRVTLDEDEYEARLYEMDVDKDSKFNYSNVIAYAHSLDIIPMTEEEQDLYNEKVDQINDLYDSYEAENFDEKYEILIGKHKALKVSLDNYNEEIEDFADSRFYDEEMNKMLGMDYSLTARAGAALEDFFIHGTYNIGMNLKEGGLRFIKFLNNDNQSPEREARLDDSIKTCQETLQNYNIRVQQNREENIPPPITLDDIGKDDVGIFDYIGQALADNSPSILTTFIPGLTAIRSASLLKAASGQGFAAIRKALIAQKTYGLYAMRASTGIFFAGESGGKIGEIAVQDFEKNKRIDLINQALERTGPGAIVNEEQRNILINERDDLEDDLNSNVSYFAKAFSSYAYGGTAALAERLGSLKLVSGVNASARHFGKTVAKANMYKNSTNFAGVISKGIIKGLRPAVTKAMPSELMEEALTQVSHNAIDTIVLGEDKSLLEGLDAEFFVQTAITSFAIMAPTTMSNTRNILQNEFRTRDAVRQNKLDVNELLVLNSKIPSLKGRAKLEAYNKRKRLVKKLGFADGMNMQKLNHMSEAEIREVAELSRQERDLGAQMRGLAKTGDVQGSDFQKAKNSIDNQYKAIAERKNELLGAKKRNMMQKMTDLNNNLGMSVNLDLEYTLGLNDFAMDAAMTMSDKNKKFTVVSEAAFQDESVMRSELKAEGYTDSQIDTIVNKFTGDAPANGLYVGDGDILINQGAIDRRMHGASGESEANYAAVAPLEELFHQVIGAKGLRIDGKLKDKAARSTAELLQTIENKIEVENNPRKKKALQDLKGRIDLYKTNGVYNYEEMMAQINNALAVGDLQPSDLSSIPTLKSFINGAIQNVLGDPSWMLQLETSSDVANFLKSHQDKVLEGDVQADTGEDDPLNAKPTIRDREALESAGVAIGETQAMLNESIINTLKDPNISEANKELLTKRLIDDNAGLLLGENGVNFDTNFRGFRNKETGRNITRQDVLNEVSTKIPNIINAFDLQGDANIATYMAASVKAKVPEIKEALIGAREAAQRADLTEDVAVEEQQDFDAVETAAPQRAKLYPSSNPVIQNKISDEVRANTVVRLKDDINQSIASNITSPKAVAQEIVEQTKTPRYRTDLKQDLGRFGSTEFTNNVDKLITPGFIKTIPAATLKRRFGKLLGIEKTGTVPTTNIVDGKRTDFNKPVYKIPALTDNKIKQIKDYFKAGEKRHQSLMSLLGEGIAVEQIQELKGDTQFMQDLQGKLEIKGSNLTADQFMDEVAYNLDKRNLEDKSFDKVLASEGKKIKAESRGKSIAQQRAEINLDALQDIMQTSGINVISKDISGDVTVNDSNRTERQQAILTAIKEGKIPSPLFRLLKLGNFGRKKVNGVRVNIPARGSLYYGTKDPAYQEALKAAQQNDANIDPKVLDNFKKVKRITIKSGEKLSPARKRAIAAQEKINMNALNDFYNILNKRKDGKLVIPLNDSALLISQAYQGTTGLIKIAAPFTAVSDRFVRARTGKQSLRKEAYIEEHSPPASAVGAAMIYGLKDNQAGKIMKGIRDNFVQVQLSTSSDLKLDRANLDKTVPNGMSILTPNVGYLRLAAAGINLNTITDLKTNKPVANNVGLTIPSTEFSNPSAVNYQNRLAVDVALNDLSLDDAKARLKVSMPVQVDKNQGVKRANDIGSEIFNENRTAEQIKETQLNSFESKGQALKYNKPTKGISVFDFDDTLAKTKEKVIVNMPDGEVKEISASEFAKEAGNLTDQGAKFDFSNFENVAKGTKPGPLADLARKRQGKFGSGDIFVLTARPNSAGPAIKQFLGSIGINIPLKNITGLEDGSPQAKADWVLNKAAEGYNDFYFADDSAMNVAGVKAVLDGIDVKNDVQQALESKGKNLDKDFNKQLEEVTGVESFKKYSNARAALEGKQKDKGIIKRFIRQFKITPSADDFMGLMYAFAGKGKQGNKHLKFIEDNLMNPYNKAERELLSAKVAVANDFAALKKKFPSLKGSKLSFTNPLLSDIGVGPYNKSQAVRVYLWNKQGMDIPGMSKRDINALVKAVEADAELNTFADELALISKSNQYPAPGKNWLGGSIKTDMLDSLDKTFRAKAMEEFNQNADIIFSEKNLNKIEAIYGTKFREALEDSLRRMKSGSNRPILVGSGSRLANEMLDWLNASVANVMFLNMRSGLLQTLSTVNFINWGDNNIWNASKAFASKEMWPTFMRLMNSDYLVNRRDGLKINVNEAELADAAKRGGIKGAFSYLLDKGFAITRVMDSFAIALGGSTFFINRKKALLKRVNPATGELYTEAEADEKAFADFYAIAEETQQSSNPSRISSQQASIFGRTILSFQNVTMQFNRKTKKSIQDLFNRRKKPGMTQRESDMSNLSSIVYYVGMQNLMFNALQQGLFAMLFDEDDEKENDRAASIANGMADSLLFGLGFGGAIISTAKNITMKIMDESERKSPDYEEVIWDVFDVSPVIDSKVRKLRTAAKTFMWNTDQMKRRGWSLDNPAYLAIAQVISAATNAPVDRVLQKMNNLRQASDESTRMWTKVALIMGWTGWNFGLPYWGRQSTIDREEKEDAKLKEQYENKVREVKKQGFTKRVPLTGPNAGKPDGKLGVDYVQIERPDGVIQYYKKKK